MQCLSADLSKCVKCSPDSTASFLTAHTSKVVAAMQDHASRHGTSLPSSLLAFPPCPIPIQLSRNEQECTSRPTLVGVLSGRDEFHGRSHSKTRDIDVGPVAIRSRVFRIHAFLPRARNRGRQIEHNGIHSHWSSYLEFMLFQDSEARPGAPKLVQLQAVRGLVLLALTDMKSWR
jgi:hypothetical protein